MEAWQVPIILGALEFLYDIGRGLLVEIRERRKADSEHKGAIAQGVEHQEGDDELDRLIAQLTRVPKDVMLKAAVDEALVESETEEIEHLLRLIDIYTKNYRAAKEKAAVWGPGLTPPIVMHELLDAENNLLRLTEQLQRIVDKAVEPPQ